MHRNFTDFLRIAFAFFFVLFVAVGTKAQNYNLTGSSGVFTPIIGGTVLPDLSVDDEISSAISIPFAFAYYGTNYTQFKVSSNGFISFDAALSDPLFTNSIAANANLLVAPLWDDLSGTGGTASYLVTGSTPNRVVTIEWLNWRWSLSATSPTISFQVKLFETTNAIVFVYRREAGTLSSPEAAIGLTGNVAGKIYSLRNVSGAPALSKIGYRFTQEKPATGQTYTFTPAGAAVVPSTQAMNVAALPDATTAQLSWTRGNGAYTAVFVKQTSSTSETVPAVNGTPYEGVDFFPDGDEVSDWYCVYNGVGTSTLLNDLSSNTAYRVQVIEYNGQLGDQKYLTTTSTSNPVNFTTLPSPSQLESYRVSSSDVTLDVAEGNYAKRAVFVRAGVGGTPAVADNTTYTANTTLGSGSQVGTSGWYCVFNGTNTTSFSVAGLAPETTYTAVVVDYSGAAGAEDYVANILSSASQQFTTYPSTPAISYTFSSSTETFTPLTGATEVSSLEMDENNGGFYPIGFTFYFAGVPFTEVGASSNGFITFNKLFLNTPFFSSSNSLGMSDLRPLIAPLWDDIDLSGGKVSYATTGVEPNRVFTFEFLNAQWDYHATVGISFQVKLYESDNHIDFIYRQEAGALTTPSASIGLAYPLLGSGNFLSLNGTGTSPGTSTTVETSNLSIKPATNQKYTFTPVKLTQTITFNALTGKTFGDAAFTLAATATSSLPVSYSSSNPDVATVSGNTVTIVGAGNVDITASQSGNANFNAATSVVRSLVVAKANQTITFNTLANKIFGDPPFALAATSTSGLPVSYNSSNTAVATVSGNTVTIVGAGTTDITASHMGNSNFNPASNVIQPLTVGKGNQAITFGSLPAKLIGDVFTLTATSSSGAPVSYSSSNTSVATVSGSTVTVVGAGTTNITASQAGNTNYNAAVNLIQPLFVKSNQAITFDVIPVKTLGDAPFNLTATASSALAVSFSTSSDKISIAGSQVTLVKAGSVTVKADQAGNENFAVAPALERTFCINPAKPTITASALDTEAPVLTSSSTNGNQWFRDNVSINGANGATIAATQAGVYTVVTTVDDCSSSPSEGFSLVITGIEISDPGVSVFPNPITNEIVVDVTKLRSTEDVEVYLFDTMGRRIHSEKGNGRITIQTGSYIPGPYVLKVATGKKMIVKKLVKK